MILNEIFLLWNRRFWFTFSLLERKDKHVHLLLTCMFLSEAINTKQIQSSTMMALKVAVWLDGVYVKDHWRDQTEFRGNNKGRPLLLRGEAEIQIRPDIIRHSRAREDGTAVCLPHFHLPLSACFHQFVFVIWNKQRSFLSRWSVRLTLRSDVRPWHCAENSSKSASSKLRVQSRSTNSQVILLLF